MNLTIFWLVLMVGLVVTEILTMGLTTIWFAIGALGAVICSGCGLPFLPQFIVFVVISLFLILFTRPIAVKYFNHDRVRTNAESLVGKQAIVTEDINNLQATGHVTVSGQEWMARSNRDDVSIQSGAVTEILAIHGAKLIVREVRQEQKEPVNQENPLV